MHLKCTTFVLFVRNRDVSRYVPMYAVCGVQESLEGERTQYSLPDGSSLEVMHDGSMFTSFMAQWEESIALVPRRGSWG